MFSPDSVYAFRFLTTIDSSGFLVTQIPSSSFNHSTINKNNIEHNINSEYLQAMIRVIPSVRKYSFDNIQIYFPEKLSSGIIAFTERMNNILNIFKKDFNFDFKFNNSFESYNAIRNEGYSTWKWPIRFFVIGKKTSSSKSFFADEFEFEDGLLNFTVLDAGLEEFFSKQVSFQFAFRLVTLLEWTFNGNHSESNHNLFIAIALWLETHLYPYTYDDPPSYLSANSLSVFDGFAHKDISIELATILRYLVKCQELDVGNFGPIFEEAHDKNTNHYYFLISKVNRLIMDWFPDYIEKYIIGNVFKIDGSAFLNHDGDWFNTFEILSATDTLKVFTKEFNDLSAKRFFVELNHEFEDESASLILDAYKSSAANNDGVATIVFSIDANNNLTHLVTGRSEEVEIPNLKGLYQSGTKKFLVAVVNCINNGVDYTGETEIDLVAKIRGEKQVLGFNTCDLWIYLKGRYSWVTPDTSYTGNDGLINPGAAEYKGVFSETTFTASHFEEMGPDLTKTGSIVATLDESQSQIVSLDWTENRVHSFYGYTITKALSAQNIPLSSTSDSRMTFVVIGESVTDHIITLRDEHDGLSYTIQDFWSEADSYIKVDFYIDD